MIHLGSQAITEIQPVRFSITLQLLLENQENVKDRAWWEESII